MELLDQLALALPFSIVGLKRPVPTAGFAMIFLLTGRGSAIVDEIRTAAFRAEVRTEAGKLYLFVAIDRTSKFAYAELHEHAGKMEAA